MIGAGMLLDTFSDSQFKLFEVLGKRFLFRADPISSYELDEKSWNFLQLCRRYASEKKSDAGKKGDDGLLDYVGRHMERAEAVRLLGEITSMFATIPEAESSTLDLPEEDSVEYAVFNISHACNMKCDYCSVEQGRFGGSEKLMSKETARKAVDFIIQHYKKEAIAFGFFGGEPLVNFDTLQFIVEYGKSLAEQEGKKASFYLTTNGTLLTEDVVDFLEEHRFHMIASLDGPKHLHDRMRKFRDGRGTFDTIFRNLERIRNTPLSQRTTLRSTYANESSNLLERLIFLGNLVDAGYGIGFSVEPAMFLPNDSEYISPPEQFAALIPDYNRYAEIFLQKLKDGEPIRFFHLCHFLTRMKRKTKFYRDCGCGTSYVVINPDGHLHSCHQEWDNGIGDIHSGFDDSAREWWSARTVEEKSDCSACWARYVCGGGCEMEYSPASDCAAFVTSRQFECQMKQHLIKLAIWIISELQRDDHHDESG